MQCPPYNTYGPLFTYNILLLSLMQDLMLLLATLAALNRQYFAQSQACTLVVYWRVFGTLVLALLQLFFAEIIPLHDYFSLLIL